MNDSFLEKAGAEFVQHLVRKVCAKLIVDSWWIVGGL